MPIVTRSSQNLTAAHQVPKYMPKHLPGKCVLRHVPENVPTHVLNHVPETVPEIMLEHVPETVFERVPKQMPQNRPMILKG